MATVNKDFRVKNGLIVEGSTATVNGNDILTTASTIGTDSLAEGSTNLFFTEARAIAAVGENLSLNDLSDVSGVESAQTGYVLMADGQGGWTANVIPSIGSTDDVSEGSSNLYFTNARAQSAIDGASLASLSVGNLTDFSNAAYALESYVDSAVAGATLASTNELSEGTSNLYFTNARAVSAVDGSTLNNLTVSNQLTVSTFADITALEPSSGTLTVYGNLVDGTNAAYALESYVDTQVAALIDAAPGALDTLNELAAAIGDDPNFATTVTNLINNLDTDGVTEGSSNLYFTNARAQSAIDGASLASLSVGNLTDFSNAAYALESYVDSAVAGATLASTDELSEGTTNLYFTDARAVAAVNGSTIDSIKFGGTYATELTTITASGLNGSAQSVGSLPQYLNGAKLIVTVMDMSSNDIEISEVLVAFKSGNAYITEYGNVTTNASLGDIDIDGSGNVTYTSSTTVSLEIAVVAQWGQSA